jgi:hypothetical protein
MLGVLGAAAMMLRSFVATRGADPDPDDETVTVGAPHPKGVSWSREGRAVTDGPSTGVLRRGG